MAVAESSPFTPLPFSLEIESRVSNDPSISTKRYIGFDPKLSNEEIELNPKSVSAEASSCAPDPASNFKALDEPSDFCPSSYPSENCHRQESPRNFPVEGALMAKTSEITSEIVSNCSNYQQNPTNQLVEVPKVSSSSTLTYSSDLDCSPMGAGLQNLGNTCFLNAILQCFTHTVPLVQSLRSCNHASPCSRSQGGFCTLCALREHIEESLASSGGIIQPENLVQNLSYVSSSFQKYQQEDAHEFLQCMLDKLHICSSEPKRQEQEKPSFSQDEDSFVKQIFGGRLRSQVKCCNCGHCSNTYEPLTDLSLEVEDADTLLGALRLFTQVEKIGDQDTKFTCESCKVDVLVEKQLTLDKVPTVATFHLKRFKNDGSHVEKITKFVDYPLELDLRPFLSSPDDQTAKINYELYAVVVHEGYFSAYGHYICYIRSSQHSWHRLDDEKVQRVSEKFVLSQSAYILLYIKQGSPWFATLMKTNSEKSPVSIKIVSISPKSALDDSERKSVPFSKGNEYNSIFENTSKNDAERASSKNDAERASTPLSLRRNNLVDLISKTNDDSDAADLFPPATPPRSPSPEIVSKVPFGAEHVMAQVDRTPRRLENCKRPTGSDGFSEDVRTKSLQRYLRGMPTSRRSAFISCIQPSPKCRSEGSLDNERKRRRILRDSDARAGVSQLNLSPRSVVR